MKIVCEACQAKYSISDDKVRGKVFKIRCKKCSHIIVVRGTEDGVESGVDEAGAEAPAAAAPAVDAQWYVVIDGEQVGPLTIADVGGRIARGEIAAESFAWREGMADWSQLSSIPEFSGQLGQAPHAAGNGMASAAPADDDSPFAPQPTAVMPPGQAEDMFRQNSASARPVEDEGGDPFAGGATAVSGSPAPAGDLFAPAATVAAPARGDDLFQSARPRAASSPGGFGAGAGLAASAPAGGGLFPAASSAGGGDAASLGMTAQRSENSVLFSLSNLEALAGPANKPAPMAASPGLGGGGGGGPVTEGSGLIDIRAMASLTLGRKDESPLLGGSAPPLGGDFPSFGAAPLAPVMSPLLPVQRSSGMPKWAIGLIAGGVILVLGLTVVLVKVLLDKPEIPVAAQQTAMNDPQPIAAAPAAAAPTEAPPTARVPEPEAAPPPAEDPPPAAAAPSDEGKSRKPSSGSRSRDRDKPRSSSSGNSKPAAAAPAPAPEPEKPTPAPTRKPSNSIDDLLAGALSGSAKKPSAPSSAPAAAAAPVKKLGPLSKTDIVKTMSGVTPKAQACYDKYKVPGRVNVNIKVEPSGKVSSASAGGSFAGTPTGSCVEAAIKSAKFPASDAGMTFPYPVSLR